MNKEQADELAAKIKAQFPSHIITVWQVKELRNIAPHNWAIDIKPSEEYQGESLRIHNVAEWHEAFLAWQILRG